MMKTPRRTETPTIPTVPSGMSTAACDKMDPLVKIGQSLSLVKPVLLFLIEIKNLIFITLCTEPKIQLFSKTVTI